MPECIRHLINSDRFNVSLAIFDLDNTLIADDSDYLWGQFLVDQGIVDKAYYEAANIKFYKQYKEGNLDILEFLSFSLKPLADNDTQQLYEWRKQFIRDIITPILLTPAQELINQHRAKGDCAPASSRETDPGHAALRPRRGARSRADRRWRTAAGTAPDHRAARSGARCRFQR